MFFVHKKGLMFYMGKFFLGGFNSVLWATGSQKLFLYHTLCPSHPSDEIWKKAHVGVSDFVWFCTSLGMFIVQLVFSLEGYKTFLVLKAEVS